jgi:hypothetical protein
MMVVCLQLQQLRAAIGRGARETMSANREDEDACPKCGGAVEETAASCPHCGAKFEYEDDSEDDVPAPISEARSRRDLEPHRGSLNLTLGIISLAISPCDLCLCGMIGVVTMIIGSGLAITTFVLASGDLKKMARHDMDWRGRGTTEAARVLAIIALCLHILFLLLIVLMVTGAVVLSRTTANQAPGPPGIAPPPAKVAPPPAPAPPMRPDPK